MMFRIRSVDDSIVDAVLLGVRQSSQILQRAATSNEISGATAAEAGQSSVRSGL